MSQSEVDPAQPVEGHEQEHGNMTTAKLDLKEILKLTTARKTLQSPQLQASQARASTQCSNILAS